MARQINFEKEVNLNQGIITVTRKVTKVETGQSIGPKAGVYVIVDVEPRTEERAEEIYQEFVRDWKGSVAKYGIDVEIG